MNTSVRIENCVMYQLDSEQKGKQLVQKLSWFYVVLMASLIWGVVLLHDQPQDALILPTQFSVLESNQESLPHKNDRRWQQYTKPQLKLSANPMWLKFTFNFDNVSALSEPGSEHSSKGVFISILGAYSVYLNGHYIGNNGRPVSNDKNELPGEIDSVFLLPQQWITSEDNTLLLRFSSQYHSSTMQHSGTWVFADDYASLLSLGEERVRLPIMMLSGLLLVALYSFQVYFSSLKEPAYIWFSGLSTMLVLLILAESWRGLFGYSYVWHAFRMEVILWLTLLVSTLLPMFFMAFFNYPKRILIGLLLSLSVFNLLVIFLEDSYDFRSLILFGTSLISSFAISVFSIIKHKKYALIMTVGIAVFISPILVSRLSFMDQYFFVSFSCLALLMLLVLSQTHAERQHALNQSRLTTQRLELELVKKQLQPHFILNTLTAIEEWIDTSPSDAVSFIQALALEFRQMAQLSNQSFVTFAQEIALCESHLKIMGYRFDAQFNLVNEGVSKHALIPPGILLTLIENAFSHNNYEAKTYDFFMIANEDKSYSSQIMTRVIFKSQKCGASKNENGLNLDATGTSASIGTGVGTKYIKARLTEAYGKHWYFDECQEPHFWTVTLTFPLKYHSKPEIA